MNEVNNIYYIKNISDPTRPTIVFLHGLSANHTTWDVAAKSFQKQGYNTLSLDMRGHGLSDKTRKRNLYRFPVFKKDLRAIIEKEQLFKVILIGYSFGGTVALDYASQYPEDVVALITISANHVSPFRYSWLSFAAPIAAGLVNLGGWLMLWQKRRKYYNFDQSVSTGYWQDTFRGFITMPISINLWMLSEAMNISRLDQINHITCPALLLRGSHDAYFSLAEAADMQKEIRGAEIISLDNSGHYLASDYQEKTISTITDFLNKKHFI
jgi:pimeloyl-ACP methyl ester carboxylesterase